MKTVSSGMLTHLSQDVTTLATCWKMIRTDGTVFALTDHDQDLVVSGVTFLSSDSYTRTAIKSDSTAAVDNLDVVGMLSSDLITDQDIENGLYDYAQIQMFVVNWANLSQGIISLRQGWLGEVVLTPTGVFKAELRGLMQAFSTQWGDLFSPICRADLGDTQCTIDLSAITHSGTVLTSTSNNAFTALPFTFTPFSSTNEASVVVSESMTFANDGLGIGLVLNGVEHDFTVFPGNGEGENYVGFIERMVSEINTANLGVTAAEFFTADNVGGVTLVLTDDTVEAVVIALGDTSHYLTVQSFSDGYFDNGIITWLTGNNTGVSIEIKTYLQGSVTMFLNMNFPIQVGDTFNYTPGCDKRRGTCFAKFNNINNFRGEPDMPGQDAMMTYPEFGSSGGI